VNLNISGAEINNKRHSLCITYSFWKWKIWKTFVISLIMIMTVRDGGSFKALFFSQNHYIWKIKLFFIPFPFLVYVVDIRLLTIYICKSETETKNYINFHLNKNFFSLSLFLLVIIIMNHDTINNRNMTHKAHKTRTWNMCQEIFFHSFCYQTNVSIFYCCCLI
jgi:hypothetical protein